VHFSGFGIMYEEKSGNPEKDSRKKNWFEKKVVEKSLICTRAVSESGLAGNQFGQISPWSLQLWNGLKEILRNEATGKTESRHFAKRHLEQHAIQLPHSAFALQTAICGDFGQRKLAANL
jgi:hypothetical protein